MLAPRRSADPTRTVRDQFLVEITGAPARPAGTLRRPGRAQQAVHRVGRDRLPPPRTLRDRGTAAGALARRRPVPAAGPGRARGGVPLGGPPHGDQDRAGVVAGQHLSGRSAAGRAPGRVGVRPVRPHHRRGPRPRHPRFGTAIPFTGSGGTPTSRPDPNSPPDTRPDRDRLRPPDRRHPHPATARADQLHRPARQHRPQHRRRGRPTPRHRRRGRARTARTARTALRGRRREHRIDPAPHRRQRDHRTAGLVAAGSTPPH